MSVSSISSSDWATALASLSSTSSSSSSSSSSKTDPQKLWDSLADALDSGDLDAAKSAFETLQANRPEPPPDAKGSGQGGSQSGSSESEDPFEALQAALEADDIEAAKEALSTIQANKPSGPPPQMDPSFNNDTTGSVGTLLNMVA